VTETETEPLLGIMLAEVEVGEGSRTLLPDTPICERMRRCLSTWRKITSNKTVLSWIEFGLPYEFDDQPPPPYKGVEYQLDARMSKVRDEELLRLESLGVIEDLPKEELSSATFNGIFVVERKDKLRPIIDQRYPNSFTTKIHFKMESIRDVRDLIRPGELMFKIDFKDAYLHLRFRRNHWKYGSFWWRGKAKCFNAMMFGHVHGPRWFTKLMKPFVKYLRSIGIRCVIYLDDLLVFCGDNFQEARRLLRFVFSLLLALGITVNTTKSILEPVRRLEYLGFIVNTKTMSFSIEKGKLKAFCRDCKRLINRGSASARDLARVLGKISSMSAALLPWRLRTRATLLSKNQALRATGSWDKPFSLGGRVIRELEFWINNVKIWNGKPIHEAEPDWVTTSDSSGTGYGGHSRDTLVAHYWEPEWEGRHSTLLETLSASRVIQEIIEEEDLHDGTLLHQSDNTTAVSYLNKQGGKIPTISEIAEEIWDFCLERGIQLRSQYVPGIRIESADFLSRMKEKPSEMKIPRNDFEEICRRWGAPTIDLFATRFNCQTARFMTLFPDPKSVGTDAFSTRWSLERLPYAFPPFNQIGRILAKVRKERCQLILVTPEWESATWWPDLMMLAKSHLRLSGKLLNLEEEETASKWPLLAWKL
jgi:hypothetical protein